MDANKTVEQIEHSKEYFVFYQVQLEIGLSIEQAVLYNFVDGYTQRGMLFWFSNATISKKLHISVRSIQRHISWLVSNGYLNMRMEDGNTTRYLSTTPKGSANVHIGKVVEHELNEVKKDVQEAVVKKEIQKDVKELQVSCLDKIQIDYKQYVYKWEEDVAKLGGKYYPLLAGSYNYWLGLGKGSPTLDEFNAIRDMYPHYGTRSSKKKTKEQVLKMDRRTFNEYYLSCRLLAYEVKSGITDGQFIPAMERRITNEKGALPLWAFESRILELAKPWVSTNYWDDMKNKAGLPMLAYQTIWHAKNLSI